MKYWQEERWQTATKLNVPHLYLYTWIRVCLCVTLIINSMIMLFITKEGSRFDVAVPRDEFFYIMAIVCEIGWLPVVFSPRKVDRTLRNVLFEVTGVGMVSAMYVCGNEFIVLFYIVELGVIIYWGIKIDKDNRVVDNNKIVLWWKRKKQEEADREKQRWLEERKRKSHKIELTEEQKLKKMSRKQRKEYNQKKGN